MLKGHTKIELTNVKTGQKQVIEDNNMVTNAMSKMFEQTPFSQWGWASNPFTNKLPLIDRLCGGILLFADPIEEDPDNCFTPSGNKMVGNARINYASAQDVPEFGAFNAEESSWNPETGERKYVYDFATSKGNGTISCVCLTNPFVGYYGLGNTSGKFESITVENVDFNTYQTTPSSYYWGMDSSFPTSFDSSDEIPQTPRILFGVYGENCIYAMSQYALQYSSSYASDHVSSGTMKLYKYYCPFSSFDPMQVTCSERLWKLQETVDLEVPSAIANMDTSWTMYSTVCYDDEAFYIVFSNRNSQMIAIDSEFLVWKIKYDLSASEVITMKNNTGVGIFGGRKVSNDYSNYNYMMPMVIQNGYLICSSVRKVFKIKLTDSTDVVEFEDLSIKSTTSSTQSMYRSFYKLGDTVMGVDCNGYTYPFALNLKTNVVSPVNGTPTIRGYSNGWNHHYRNIPIVGTDVFVISAQADLLASYQSRVVRDSFMLSTINNLAEPVVKTADLAMKITYTLSLDTSDDEQEEGGSA